MRIKFWPRERRRKKRFEVSWPGTMEIRYSPEDIRHMDLTVTSFSAVGARLQTHYMDVDGCHIIMSDQRLKHFLIIERPEGVIHSQIEILCYDWKYEDSVYQIRVAFIDTSQENIRLMNLISKNLKKHRSKNK